MSEKEFNIMFSRNLKKQMEKNDITKLELAQKLGVSPASVTHWTAGEKTPRMDKVDKMCIIFGCNRSDLITDSTVTDFYLSKEAADLAEFLHQAPEYRVLFDAARKVKPEDIQFVKDFLDRIKGGD